MKKIILALLCLCALVSSSYAFDAKKCRHEYNVFKCVQYISNYDGDTITVSIPGQHDLFGEEVSVRLNGIDTPEKRTQDKCEKRLSLIAKDYLRYKILKSKSGTIELRDIQRGKYFRVVAEVWVNGKNINKAMIKAKLAVPYFGDTKHEVDWCSFKPKLPKRMYKFLRKHDTLEMAFKRFFR